MKSLFAVAILTLSVLNAQYIKANDIRPNVILFMLDGVRWQEFFHGSDPSIDISMHEPSPFKYLLSSQGRPFFLVGDRKKGSESTISNSRMISLPAYQSIMAGKTTACQSNSCGRIKIETVQERLLRELDLKRIEVATIASWGKISDAVERQEGSTFVNAGIQEMQSGKTNSETIELNKKQKEDIAPWDARKDEYTFAQALIYLKNNKPRFLFISLDDADEWGHKGNYPNYFSTLNGYDRKIKSLFDTLDTLGDYGQSTTVIITTDHGRGDGRNWQDHSADYPESKYIWMYGRNPKIKRLESGLNSGSAVPGKKVYTHLDIRPTIEKLMGLIPIQCDGCGNVIQELMPITN